MKKPNKLKNYKITSTGPDALMIEIPSHLSNLTDFLDYKIRKQVPAQLSSRGSDMIEYKWLGKLEKLQIRKVVKEFFEGYIKKYDVKWKSWD